MPPATDATLNINGISILTQGNMAFPVGHVLPQGQPGNIADYTPSEAFGYAMRNAILAGNQTAYQQLLNGYLYLVNQTTIYRETQQGMSGSQLAIGLIGWSPNIMNITTGQLPYPTDLPNQFVSSASDADTDIISSMIDASKLWGNLTATDSLTAPGTNIINSISVSDLATQTIQSFVENELGTFTFNNVSYYALTLDNWGHDMVYPDYFDPEAFAKMISFVGTNSSLAASLTAAAQGTIAFITAVAAANENWIPDSPYSLTGASSFGYDATRLPMRFGQYLSSGSDPLNMAPAVATILSNLINNIFSNNGNYLQWQQGGTVTFTPSGLTGGAFTGPLNTGLKSLNNTGNLPSDVTQSDVVNVTSCMDYDLTQYQTDTMTDWQNWYYSIQLALLNEQLIAQYPMSIDPEKKAWMALYTTDDDIPVISLRTPVVLTPPVQRVSRGCFSLISSLFKQLL
jgi:endo-1,4-beta-D-glucanase Y